ncbi:hypothetical protein E2C01_061682 [Portunus trituberculatus]|uniref:Uncharacterized protein n=1 Tax=Portunus trituberculatus TaxID=210409 RepID=A0A5B7HD24_PORTR|nr:hypothetical protein [Portunus trituberculatus]
MIKWSACCRGGASLILSSDPVQILAHLTATGKVAASHRPRQPDAKRGQPVVHLTQVNQWQGTLNALQFRQADTWHSLVISESAPVTQSSRPYESLATICHSFMLAHFTTWWWEGFGEESGGTEVEAGACTGLRFSGEINANN